MLTKFSINGEPYSVNLNNLPADITLNTFIRDHAGLTATKFMCQEGGCGVCICVVTGKHPATGEVQTWAVNSCLTLLNTCCDWEITTSEGLGNQRDGYHAIQKRLANLNGTQCGFCSPGFVMNMYGLLESKQGKVTMEEVENSFGGNTCRCTGYRPILDAMKSFAVDSNIPIPEECNGDIEDLGKKRCPKTGQSCAGLCNGSSQRQHFQHNDGCQWFWPKTIEDIFDCYSRLGSEKYMLVAGNTAHGVYRRPNDIKVYIDVNGVSELKQYHITQNSLVLGANLSLNETMAAFEKASEVPGFEYCKLLRHHFDLIANVPVRNMGTLAGNLTIKKNHREFPSDVYITFEALDAQVVISESATDRKTMSLDNFLHFSMDKKLVHSFVLKPYPKDHYIFDSFKIMPVAQNAHAYVNAAFLLGVQGSTVVKSARICFGGINAEFTHAKAVEEFLIGKNIFDNNVVLQIFKNMSNVLKADEVLPDASPLYREKLAHGLLYKFLLSIAPSGLAKPEFVSGGLKLKRGLSSGKHTYETIEGNFPIGMPTVKHEGIRQTAGESMYANDVAPQKNQLWAAFVTGKKVGATVTHVDLSEAMNVAGVVGYLTAKDIPGINTVTGPEPYMNFFKEDEVLFETDKIRFFNQPIGVIVADSNAAANRAAELVKITYSGGAVEVVPTLRKALKVGDPKRMTQEYASPMQELKIEDSYDITEDGSIEMGLQYHFFMEPHTTVVIPSETGFEVHAATQWMDLMQGAIATLLNLSSHDINVKVRRIGGGYGGKATRSLPAACAAALAAYRFRKPVRFVQSLESIMGSTGKRWSAISQYKFYAKNNGKIVALKNKFFQESGYLPNETVIGHTVRIIKNCYELENIFKLDGFMIRTDAPANVACRGPGSLEGIAMIENVMEHIAFSLNLDPVDVRKANMKKGHKMSEMLQHFIHSTDYKNRKSEIKVFNEKNRWRKKGLGLSVLDYKVDYFGQYGIMLAVYHLDGTLTITHGGIEMGQGMNTKIAQVAAHDLGISMDMIKFEASNSFNAANSMVTGGSVGSELLCYAVRKCCNSLKDRLKPVRESLKNPTWTELIEAAYIQDVNLVVSDHFEKNELNPYIVCGLTLTEVEVDILTGNYLVKRVDILEDTGESLNPNVDIGQVEGAFMMGLGYWTSEQIIVDEISGEIMTNRTWNYKPPGAKDIPIDFRVEFLQRSQNEAGFMRSKATGEPAICMAVSFVFAIQQAIQSARDDAGLKKSWVTLTAPMTPEHVLLNVGTDFKKISLN